MDVPSHIMLAASGGDLVTLIIWVLFMIGAAILNVWKKKREAEENAEWESDWETDWDVNERDAGSTGSGGSGRRRESFDHSPHQRQTSASRYDSYESTNRASWEAQSDSSITTENVDDYDYGDAYAQESDSPISVAGTAAAAAATERQHQAEAEAARLRRAQEINASTPLDPTRDSSQQLASMLERQRQLADAQHRASDAIRRAQRDIVAATERDTFSVASASFSTIDSLAPQSVTDIPTTADSLNPPKKTWATTASRKELRRAFIMREVFDRPRCFDT